MVIVGLSSLATEARVTASGKTTSPLIIDGALIAQNDGRDDRLPRVVTGGGFGVETFYWPRVSIGVEVEFPTTRAYETTSTIPHNDGSSDVIVARRMFRGQMISTVFGIPVATGTRTALALVFGVGVERRVFESSIYRDTLDRSGTVTQHVTIDASGPPNTDVFLWLQMPVGLDMAIALSPHWAVVPQIRAYLDPFSGLNGCCGGLHTSARLAIRWSW